MFSEYLNTIDAEKQTATAQPTPINPNFVSLAELLERVQAAPAKHLSLIDAAKLMMMWGTAKTDKPEWRCNSKTRGIVRVDATQATWATARLEYVSNRGHFESDGGNGASSDYELFGFDRKEYSDFLTLKAGKPLDLFCPMPEPQATTPSPAPVGTESASGVIHSTKARRDLMAPAIETAQRECMDEFDAPAVWAVLVHMAGAGKSPLMGVSDEGIKWQDANDEPQFFTLKNLRDRLRRSHRRAR